VVGAADEETARQVMDLYEPVQATKLLVRTATAELIKYASNAFLAAKISFANSISNLCEAVGANAHEVLEGIGSDKRIGPQFLKPGPGWGGSCFPKDTYALISIAEGAGYDFDLLRSVIRANEVQTQAMVDKVVELLGGEVAGATVAAWGLAFKAGTDDTRQSPALAILERLYDLGARVVAFDPAVKTAPAWMELADSPVSACEGADLLVILTEWPEFARVPLADVAERLRSRRLLDTRNIADVQQLQDLWFSFYSVGNQHPYTLVDAG
jgi:UDPglucose 6-dehydrogenase